MKGQKKLANYFRKQVHKTPKRNWVALLLIIIGLTTALLFIPRSSLSQAQFPEAKALSGKNMSFQELSNYFNSLATSKGAPYAYEVLKVANLPPGTDLHLLGHVVGDILFKQQGAKGIRNCTPDFRNACSHSIVIGLFSQKGTAALPDITGACRQAPGGIGAYGMCFHGLGHGVLAFNEYDFDKAVSLCRTITTDNDSTMEISQCISGAVMEIVDGGGHDHDIWAKQRPKYLTTISPLGICQRGVIPDSAKPLCYIYLTPYLFEAAGANMANPSPTNFGEAFKYCGGLPAEDKAARDSCFGGFGKEFVVLAQNRDIRNVDQMTKPQLQLVYDWCGLAGSKEGTAACVINAQGSLYWGGENKPDAAILLCNLITEPYQRNTCFVSLINTVFYFKSDRSYRSDFCNKIASPYKLDCQSRVNSN